MLVRGGLLVATLAIVLGGAAAFSAFEAHVINVTATISNALQVDTTPIDFGRVFPEEVLHHPLTVLPSASFLAEPDTVGIDYMIRQKPKCQATESDNAVQFAQVTEDQAGNFVCPAGYAVMNLLCPFLSKHSEADQTASGYEDGFIDSFHGGLGPWTMVETLATQVLGTLTKGSDPSDTWDIDLTVPCFIGQCAQDNVVPVAYQLDPLLEHASFGCDLWVETTGITRSQTGA